jgi:hypothetical protein
VTHFREVLHFVLPYISKTYCTPHCVHPRNFVENVVQVVVICVLLFTTAATF